MGPNNELIVDGKPFFPIFAWDEPGNYVDDHAVLGVNTIMGYDGSDGDVVNWLNKGQEYGLFMIPGYQYLSEQTVNHPAFLVYLLVHEQECGTTAPKETAAAIASREAQYKAQYPNAFSVNLMTASFYSYYRASCGKWMDGNFAWFNRYTENGSIISYDHYPVTGWNNAYHRIYELGDMTRVMYDEYVGRSKPVWPIIEASDQGLSWTIPATRGPLDYEMRAEAWLSIVHGAKGLGYFTISFNPFRYINLTQSIKDEMVRTNRQITQLSEAILSPEVAGVSVSTAVTNDLNMQVMIRQKGNVLYVFAVEGDKNYNPATRKTGRVTFSFSGLPISTGTIGVIDENRSIAFSNGSFSDDFSQLAVHLYSIDLAAGVCSNNLLDAPETGIDCGGNCPACQSSVSQHGVTFNFDKGYRVGQFANGDFWVRGPVSLVLVSPGFDGSHHGFEINPSSIDDQGFDARIGAFKPSLVPSLPLTVTGGKSIVKSVSSEPLNDADCRPCLKTAVVLTVLDAVPVDQGQSLFRPPYFGSQKPLYSVNDIRFDRLPSLAPTANPPSLSTLEGWYNRVQLDHKTNWMGRVMHPADNMPDYGSDIATQSAVTVLRLMLNDPVSAKRQATINFLQNGIDLFHVAQNNGKWPPNGGHSDGRKLAIAFAGVLLDNNAMRLLSATAGEDVFSENGSVFFSPVANRPLYGQPGCSETQYWNNVIEDTGSRTCRDPYGYVDGGRHPGGGYLFSANSQNWKGTALAVRSIPLLRQAWNDEEFLDFVDRWVSVGGWSQPDVCAPPDKGTCSGGTNPGQSCTPATEASACAGGFCVYSRDNYGKTFGPNPAGSCILDTNAADGIGRFPTYHGSNKDQGYHGSAFFGEMWTAYRNMTALCPDGPINGKCLCGGNERTSGICCSGVFALRAVCTGNPDCPTGLSCGNPNSCSAVCQNNSACPSGPVSSPCQCGSATVSSGFCCNGVASAVSCPPASACTGDGNCSSGFFCCQNACKAPACKTNSDCSSGQTCFNPNSCSAQCGTPNSTACSAASDCSAGSLCCSFACKQPLCASDASCGAGFECMDQGECSAYCSKIPLLSLKAVLPSFLVHGKTFEVSVLDISGKPLSDARVTYFDVNKDTNPDGIVSFVADVKAVFVEISKPGFQSIKLRKFVRTTGSTPASSITLSGALQISLDDGNVFVGKPFSVMVSDSNGLPVTDVKIVYGNETVATDAAGIALLTGQKNVVLLSASKGNAKSSVSVFPKSGGTNPDQNSTRDPNTPADDLFSMGVVPLVGGIVVVLLIVRVIAVVRKKE